MGKTLVERYIFADEAGCFTFERRQNVSRYFILCTVTMGDCRAGEALHALRRRLLWKHEDLGDYFHCTTDKQVVRDAVYEAILACPFKVQATICEKSKAQPQVRQTKSRFYQYSWLYHFKYGIKDRLPSDTELVVTAASIGHKKERLSFCNAIDDVLNQHIERDAWRVDFRPAMADAGLQVADYCAWAIQRKWETEGKDSRSYDLIKDRITYEYDLWGRGRRHYY